MDDARVVRGLQARGDLTARCASTLRDRQPPVALERVARSAPSMYGIVMYLMPSISPRS